MNSRISAVFFKTRIIDIFRVCFTERCYNLTLKQEHLSRVTFGFYILKETLKNFISTLSGQNQMLKELGRISKPYFVDAPLIWTVQNQKQYSSHLRPLIQARCRSVHLEQPLEAKAGGFLNHYFNLTKSRNQRASLGHIARSCLQTTTKKPKIFDTKTSQNLKSS